MRRRGGFTLVEMMVTLITGVMLIGGVYLVYLMAIRSWEEGSANVGLERTAGIIMDKIVRGVNSRFGIREADIGTAQIPEDRHAVTYMVDKQDPPTAWISDDVTSRYYQLGTDIWYDPDLSVPGDEIVLNRFGKVEALDLSFTLSDNVLTAKLALGEAAPRTTSRRLTVQMQTDVFLRRRK